MEQKDEEINHNGNGKCPHHLWHIVVRLLEVAAVCDIYVSWQELGPATGNHPLHLFLLHHAIGSFGAVELGTDGDATHTVAMGNTAKFPFWHNVCHLAQRHVVDAAHYGNLLAGQIGSR